MANEPYISFRQRIWQEPVFYLDEDVFTNGKGGPPVAPTRHQVDCWKAEASNFASTLDEPPYGRRDRYDLIATRAYQAGFSASEQLRFADVAYALFDPDGNLRPAARDVLIAKGLISGESTNG